MPLKWKCPPKKYLEQWLKSSLDSHTLNEWELMFLKSVQVKLKYSEELSQNQAEKLEQIYAGRTS